MRPIDTHVHVRTGQHRRSRLAQQRDAAATFRSPTADMTGEEIARYYRERDLRACVFDVDRETTTGLVMSNDEIAQLASAHADVLTGIASVDPRKGEAAVREARRAVEVLGLKGIKLQPVTQRFHLDDKRIYPLWEAIVSLGVPVIVHVGTTAAGRGAPGGRGLKLRFGRPVPHLDDVAADFPDLTIVAAHPGWPWHEELLAVVQHKGNVYMDLSGWAPKYLPDITVRYVRSLIPEKVLFGSDFPLLAPDRWLQEFEALDLPQSVTRMVLHDNAARVFDVET